MTRTLKVLVVEDEMMIALMLEDMLTEPPKHKMAKPIGST